MHNLLKLKITLLLNNKLRNCYAIYIYNLARIILQASFYGYIFYFNMRENFLHATFFVPQDTAFQIKKNKAK